MAQDYAPNSTAIVEEVIPTKDFHFVEELLVSFKSWYKPHNFAYGMGILNPKKPDTKVCCSNALLKFDKRINGLSHTWSE